MDDRVWFLDGGFLGGDAGVWHVEGWLGAIDVASESFASEASSGIVTGECVGDAAL